MSFFRDLAELLIITGSDELKEGASLIGKAAISTAEAAGGDLICKIDEKLEEHNKKVFEKNKNKQVDKKQVSRWLDKYINLFPISEKKFLQESLEKLTNEQFIQITNLSFKKPLTMFYISLFLGVFGVDRFMLRDIKMGIIKLMTFGGMLVLWLIDLFTINNRTKFYNFNKVKKYI